MVNLDLYRVFYTVAKCGSLTKAAEELFISQPAVSQAIKQLEQQLGGKLFNRVSRGMELTETGGKQMFAIVSEVIERLDKAEKEFSVLKNNATGSIRISAEDNVTTYFLMKYIIEYHEMYPNVVMTFTNASTKQSIDLIKSNKADIAFVDLPVQDNSVYFTGQTGKIHDIFAANKNYSHLFNRQLDITAISNYPVLMLDASTTTRQEIDSFLSDLNIKIQPEFEVGSVDLMVKMAKRGLGIACIPREYIKDELEKGELFELNVAPLFPVRANGVIVNKNRNFSFAVSEFLKLLNKYEKVE